MSVPKNPFPRLSARPAARPDWHHAVVTGSAGHWSSEQLQRIETAVELEISVRRTDGAMGRWTPVWVVRAGEDVFVRTWHRRETGWFGRAVASGRARVRVTGLETDVTVVDLGLSAGHHGVTAEQLNGVLLDEVDAAYRAKYGAHGDASVAGMVSARARVTTLRLDRR